jgi:prepilin-type N-terminal cleavage/methylation domain-containing protein
MSGRQRTIPAPPPGFTLIELAMSIAIIGLLLGVVLIPLATQQETRNLRDTQNRLQDARGALLGFAAAEGRLPCPDEDRDGAEDAPCNDWRPNTWPQLPSGAAAVTTDFAVGALPWQTLGLRATDIWGRLLLYGVTTEFTNAPGGLPCDASGWPASEDDFSDLCDTGQLTVFTRGDDPATGGVERKSQILLATEAVAVVVSHGSNGRGGAWPGLGSGALAAPPAGSDEAENGNSDNVVVTRTPTRDDAGCNDAAGSEGSPFCEFDDVVTWIPRTLLLHRLIEAGQLP